MVTGRLAKWSLLRLVRPGTVDHLASGDRSGSYAVYTVCSGLSHPTLT